MHHPFVPMALLGVVPVVYFAQRLGLLRYAPARWALGALIGGLIATGVAAGGVDFLYLNRMKLFIAAATAGILWLRVHGVDGWSDGRRVRAALTVMAMLAWTIHLNFLSFHGERTYMHIHDVAHYYLGSKYFGEVGYGELYIAMLRAEADRYDNHFKAIEARDLETQGLVHIRALLQRSEAVKARFTPQRWADFQEDVAFFREAMGAQYGEILKDHGFNPTPLWALIGGTLANLVPAGSHSGIVLLTLLDPLLLGGMFSAIAWAFGIDAMLLAMIYFCVLFGASFGYTGGAFLRYMWLFGVIVAVCCLRRQRHGVAGALLAWATLLRVFPAAFIVPLVCKAGAELITNRRLAPQYVRLFVAFGATAVLLFASTAVLPRAFEHWRDFSANMQRHLANDAYNTVGLTEILVYNGPSKPATPEEFIRAGERRGHILLIQLLTIVPLTLFFIVRRCRREDDVGTAALAVMLLFATLSLASYYYALLLVLILARAQDSVSLALLFAAEAMMYTLQLFEDRETVLYFYHNLLVAGVLATLYLRPAREELTGLRNRAVGSVPH